VSFVLNTVSDRRLRSSSGYWRLTVAVEEVMWGGVRGPEVEYLESQVLPDSHAIRPRAKEECLDV